MDRPVEHYWDLRLKRVQEALKKNNFSATVVRDLEDAKRMVLEQILPALPVKSVSWGGSMTFGSSGLYDASRTGRIWRWWTPTKWAWPWKRCWSAVADRFWWIFFSPGPTP